MLLKRRSHARRIEQVRRPLFPGYLFIHVDPLREQWRPILSTIGLRTLIRFGDRFGTITDDFIVNLRQREQDGVIALPETPFKVGQQVELGAGPFDGVVATILSVDEKQRLVILMDILQRPVRAKVRADQVRAV
jgi:transcriptional antiterminator RfaH